MPRKFACMGLTFHYGPDSNIPPLNLEKARIEEPIDPATYYKVNLKGEIAEEKNDLDCVTNYKLFRLGF